MRDRDKSHARDDQECFTTWVRLLPRSSTSGFAASAHLLPSSIFSTLFQPYLHSSSPCFLLSTLSSPLVPILLIFLIQKFHLAARLQSLHLPQTMKCCENNLKLEDEVPKKGNAESIDQCFHFFYVIISMTRQKEEPSQCVCVQASSKSIL